MADTDTVDMWNAASAVARQLFNQGVSPNMLLAMKNISVTMGKILCANMQHINSIVGRVGEEHGVVGHLPCTKTAMDIPTMPQHGCQCQENLPNGSCCCTDCMSHSVDLDERHQDLENAHFISLEVSSNVPGSPQLEITNSSLFQRPSSLELRGSSSRQACIENQRKSRVWNSSGPYARGQRHRLCKVVAARQEEESEAGAKCHLCGQKPAASDLRSRECWECFFWDAALRHGHIMGFVTQSWSL